MDQAFFPCGGEVVLVHQRFALWRDCGSFIGGSTIITFYRPKHFTPIIESRCSQRPGRCGPPEAADQVRSQDHSGVLHGSLECLRLMVEGTDHWNPKAGFRKLDQCREPTVRDHDAKQWITTWCLDCRIPVHRKIVRRDRVAIQRGEVDAHLPVRKQK